MSREDPELFQKRHRAEYPTFERVIAALAKENFDYRPHERSPSTNDIVWILASEISAGSKMIEKSSVTWCPDPTPGLDEVIETFHQNYLTLDDRVQELTDQEWGQSTKLYIGDKLIKEQALGDFLWYMFFDAIHHRGQLSTYIRPMGGKVPSIYGPSGDDPGPK